MPFRRICCPSCGHIHCKVLVGPDYPVHQVVCQHAGCKAAFQWEIKGGKLLIVSTVTPQG